MRVILQANFWTYCGRYGELQDSEEDASQRGQQHRIGSDLLQGYPRVTLPNRHPANTSAQIETRLKLTHSSVIGGVLVGIRC